MKESSHLQPGVEMPENLKTLDAVSLARINEIPGLIRTLEKEGDELFDMNVDLKSKELIVTPEEAAMYTNIRIKNMKRLQEITENILELKGQKEKLQNGMQYVPGTNVANGHPGAANETDFQETLAG